MSDRRHYLFSFLALIFLMPQVSVASPTVCTMTFNSSNEADIFKANLVRQYGSNARFKELISTDQNEAEQPDSKELIPRACQSLAKDQLKCDIVLISGHFAGRFFGERDYNLNLEDLERGSCRPTSDPCRERLFSAKEVYLFGCNTLAGKQKDSRSIEQYRDVLIHEGLSQEQAILTSLMRYSDFGDSNADRMANVFANSPLIYGFNSIAPAGSTISPFLARFFKSTPNYLGNQTASVKAGFNQSLATSMQGTAFTQTRGSLFNKGPAEADRKYLMCKTLSEDTALSSFVTLARSGQVKAAFPNFLSTVGSADKLYLSTLSQLKSEEEIKTYAETQAQYFKNYPSVYYNILTLQYFAGFITEEDFGRAYRKSILELFSIPQYNYENIGIIEPVQTIKFIPRTGLTAADLDKSYPNWRKDNIHRYLAASSGTTDLEVAKAQYGEEVFTIYRANPNAFGAFLVSALLDPARKDQWQNSSNDVWSLRISELSKVIDHIDPNSALGAQFYGAHLNNLGTSKEQFDFLYTYASTKSSKYALDAAAQLGIAFLNKSREKQLTRSYMNQKALDIFHSYASVNDPRVLKLAVGLYSHGVREAEVANYIQASLRDGRTHDQTVTLIGEMKSALQWERDAAD